MGHADDRDEQGREPRRHEERRPDLDGLAVVGSPTAAGTETGDSPVGNSPTMAPTSEMAIATFSEVKR